MKNSVFKLSFMRHFTKQQQQQQCLPSLPASCGLCTNSACSCLQAERDKMAAAASRRKSVRLKGSAGRDLDPDRTGRDVRTGVSTRLWDRRSRDLGPVSEAETKETFLFQRSDQIQNSVWSPLYFLIQSKSQHSSSEMKSQRLDQGCFPTFTLVWSEFRCDTSNLQTSVGDPTSPGIFCCVIIILFLLSRGLLIIRLMIVW